MAEEVVEEPIAEESPTEVARQVEELEDSIPEAQVEENKPMVAQEQEPIEEAGPDSFARKAGRVALKAAQIGAKVVSWVPLRVSARVFNGVFMSHKESSWYWRNYKGDKVADDWKTAIFGEGTYTERAGDDE
ncbi:MAG: hypothetical protein EXS52_00130 [Candidatus Staskawiczbacteria bacterium]|nr:hypothetical protein [Candidatus Staskawiczbacteria bacterium]